MTPTNPERQKVEQIVASLSETQVEAIAHAKCSVPRLNDEWSSDCICGAGRTARELCRTEPQLAMVRRTYPNGIILTDIGLAVRSLIQENGK